MPIDSPAGPLTTFDDVVSAFQVEGAAAVEARFATPVLLVNAPVQVWSEVTEVHSFGAPKRMLPAVVIPVVPGKLNRSKEKLTVGRAGVCDLILPFGAMSKVHGYLSVSPRGYTFEDAGSTNGTVLNSAKLKVGAPVPIRDGDTLRFGDVSAQFRLPASFLGEVKKRAGG